MFSHTFVSVDSRGDAAKRAPPPPGILYDYQKKGVERGGFCMNIKTKGMSLNVGFFHRMLNCQRAQPPGNIPRGKATAEPSSNHAESIERNGRVVKSIILAERLIRIDDEVKTRDMENVPSVPEFLRLQQ